MQTSLAIGALVEALAAPSLPEDLWHHATTYLELKGFDRVFHIDCSQGRSRPTVRTTMPRGFLETYHSEQFARHDPFLTYCLPSKHSISTGIAYIDDYDYLSRKARNLIEHAAQSGFQAGFSLTTSRSGSLGLEGWNVGSSLPRKEVEQILFHSGTEIRLVLTALKGRLSAREHRLTRREHQVMQLLIEGLRTREIANRLDLREVTVEFHIANIRRKLKAPTRESAVARYLTHAGTKAP